MTHNPIQNGTFSRRVALRQGFTTRKVGDKIFVLSQESQMHILENRAACFLWERLEAAGSEGLTLSSLSTALCDRFDVNQAVAQSDTLAFVERLVGLGIVVDRKAS